MKIYIAAPYPMREQAAAWGRTLQADGHIITAEWLWVDEDVKTPEAQRSYAIKDLAHVDAADAVLLMTGYRGERAYTGGRHVEYGYALAKGKALVVCGGLESVFHHLDGVVNAPTFDAARDALAQMQPR